MKLYGVTFTYNESIMIPYVMKYLERMGFNKLIVYDNQSTDNTVELLRVYPFIEIRTLNTGGSKSNKKITEIKNEVWKEFSSKEDAWVFISDFDEVIYYNGNIKEYLETAGKNGYNYLNQDMIQTICKKFPEKENLVHENCDGGVFWGNSNVGGCKMTLFRINDFISVTYAPGAHRVRVKLKKNCKLKSLNNKEIKSFHLKFIDKDYCLERKNIAKNRRGPDDKKNGYGIQYDKPDSAFIDEWKSMERRTIDVNNYVSGKINGMTGASCISEDMSDKGPIDPISLMYGI